MKTMKKVGGIFFLCSFVFLAAYTCSCWAQGNLLLIVPPEASGGNEGNSSLAPFATTMSGRFQQVYSASIFAGVLPPEGGFIRALSFRIDANGSFHESQIGSLQVNLSTTTRAVDNLSAVFADNVGADDRVMLGPATYRMSGGPGSGFSANAIGGGTFVSDPFYYNPAKGNLLLDFRIFTGAGNFPAGGVLDAFNVGGDSVSSVFASFGASLPTSGSPSSLGLATAFSIMPVPEPSSWALLIAGTICFSLCRKRQRNT